MPRAEQTAWEGPDLPRTLLAHHEQESVIVIVNKAALIKLANVCMTWLSLLHACSSAQ